jgi:hypothetical protein
VPAHQPRQGTKPAASTGQPKPIRSEQSAPSLPPVPAPKAKPLNTAAQLWAGVDIDRSLEMSMKEVEERLAEEDVTNAGAADLADEVHAQNREAAEKEEKARPGLSKAWDGMKAQLHKFASPSAQKGQVQGQQGGAVKEQASAPVKAPVAAPARPASAASAANLRAVQKNMLAGSMRSEKLPDAFSLLKEAKEAGVLFVEDSQREGHAEELEDPELSAAVEECIRICFGVRGILRIGAGRNDLAEPIIVVSTSHGFSESSLAKVPESVHRFPTLIAIPFDLLPLKRDFAK